MEHNTTTFDNDKTLYDLPAIFRIKCAERLAAVTNWTSVGAQIDDCFKIEALRSRYQNGLPDASLCKCLLEELAMYGVTVPEFVNALKKLGINAVAQYIEQKLKKYASNGLNLPGLEVHPSYACYFFLIIGDEKEDHNAIQEQFFRELLSDGYSHTSTTTHSLGSVQVEFTRLARENNTSGISIVFSQVNKRQLSALRIIDSQLRQIPNLVIVKTQQKANQDDIKFFEMQPEALPSMPIVDRIMRRFKRRLNNLPDDEEAAHLGSVSKNKFVVVGQGKQISQLPLLIHCIVEFNPPLFPVNDITFVLVKMNNHPNSFKEHLTFKKYFPCIIAAVQTGNQEGEAVVACTTYDYYKLQVDAILTDFGTTLCLVEFKQLDVKRLHELINFKAPKEDLQKLKIVKRLFFTVTESPPVHGLAENSHFEHRTESQFVETKLELPKKSSIEIQKPNNPAHLKKQKVLVIIVPSALLHEDVCFLLENCFHHRCTDDEKYKYESETRDVYVCTPSEDAFVLSDLLANATEVVRFSTDPMESYGTKPVGIDPEHLINFHKSKLRIGRKEVRNYKEIHAYLTTWFNPLASQPN